MGRRYLSAAEAQAVLNLGKTVDCLIGACERDGVAGIRHCSISHDAGRFASSGIQLHVYESIDRGYFDDESGPLNPALEFSDADETLSFETLISALNYMEARWPGTSQTLVNESMLPHEYDDRLRGLK